MFTGLIRSVCKVSSLSNVSGGMKLTADIGRLAESVKTGDSIAVNGACLTVRVVSSLVVEFDVSSETVAKTTIGKLRPGAKINIEPAMSAADKFGGHFVQGHVDSLAKVKQIKNKGNFWEFVFTADKEIVDLLVPKGSIAIDGVSLTITNAEGQDFGVAIIPETFENTIFKYYKVGNLVNIETDILCRIIKKQLNNILSSKQSVTIDKLQQMGF